MLELDMVQTVAFGGVVLLAGYGLRRLVPVLARLNLPAPVLGGLLVSLAIWAARSRDVELVHFDTALQSPLMIAFFTTVGFGASVSMLKTGGPLVFRFLVLATLFAVLQNVLGVAVAWAFGLHPLFGVLAGSVTLTGGPATGLAFAPLFEEAGVPAAASVAVAVAMAGIVAGGLVGSPLATWLIDRHKLRADPSAKPAPAPYRESSPLVEGEAAEDDDSVFPLLRNTIALLVAMWLGSYVSAGFTRLGVTLPPTIGAMIVAAAIRNADDRLGWLGLSHRLLDSLGAIALSLFLVLALMSLRLWELANLAVPLVVGLALQIAMILAAAVFVFRRMGKDYEAAVMSGGFIGFMLGTTANAMAVMRALTDRYGPAPRAFLVAPLVGAFFIDFINALLITGSLNLFE